MKRIICFWVSIIVLMGLVFSCSLPESVSERSSKTKPEGEPNPDSELPVVILDFSTRDGDGMIVTYRVGQEEQVTETIEERYHRYVTGAEENSMVFARIRSIPENRSVELAVSVNGKLIAGGSNLDEMIETVPVYDPESPSTHNVIVDFLTGGTGMVVTYRVGNEDQVIKTVEDTYYCYSTTADLYSSVLTRVQAIPDTADCGISVTADGVSLGGSSGYPGELVKQFWVFFGE